MGVTSQADASSFSVSRQTLGHTYLAACLFFGMSAQLLLKFGMLQVQTHPGAWTPHLWVLSGLVVYALGTGFWLLCLAYLDLSYAYPFTALTYVLVLVASCFLLGEKVSLQRIAGVLLVCLGVGLVPAGYRSNP